MNLGVFLPNWIGDVAMATPALRALRAQYPPPHRIVGIMRPYVSDVLAGTAWLDEQLHYDPRSKDKRLSSRSLIRQLRERKLDSIVLFTNSLRTAALAWASGAPQRIGYVCYGRGLLLTHKLYYPRVGRKYLPTPAIDAYLQLAYVAGCGYTSPRMELATLPEDERAADEVWRRLKLPLGRNVAVLNSGGAFGAAKQWPAKSFAELAQHIVSRLGMAVLVNCGPAERKIAEEIVERAAHPRVVHLDDAKLPLGLTKACIRRSGLLVTTDSGPRFFGIAFGVPTVTLFGPTHAAWSRTHAEHEICLSVPVPCGPCMQRVCPLGHHRCMTDLSVESVQRAAERLLASSGSAQAA